MSKRKKPRRGPRQKPTPLQLAERSLQIIADREGKSMETIRGQIQIGMMAGLLSEDPAVQAEWAKIPRAGKVPTPEEVIAYFVEDLTNR